MQRQVVERYHINLLRWYTEVCGDWVNEGCWAGRFGSWLLTILISEDVYRTQSMLYFNAMDKKWDGIGIATPEEEARLIELKGDRTDMHGEQ